MVLSIFHMVWQFKFLMIFFIVLTAAEVNFMGIASLLRSIPNLHVF